MEQRREDDIDEKVWKDNFADGIQSEEACLAFHDQDYVEKIKEFHFYLDSVTLFAKFFNRYFEYVGFGQCSWNCSKFCDFDSYCIEFNEKGGEE